MLMKILRLFLTILPLIALGRAEIPLPDNWVINIGNDSSWSTIEYNDSAWYPITVPSAWEDQGFASYDGFAWYRLAFNVDTNIPINDSLYLILGKTGDVILPFINGLALDSSACAFDSTEIVFYKFPADILADNNLLAIQINDLSGKGGILAGPVKIAESPPVLKSEKQEIASQHSYSKIPFSNGLVTASYDVETRVFSSFMPHIYSRSGPDVEVVPVATSARTVLFKNRREIALTELQTQFSGYLDGTGIVYHSMSGPDFTLDQYALTPFTIDKPFWVFYAVLRGKSLEQYSLNFAISDILPTLNVGKWSFQDGSRKWLFVICSYDEVVTPKSFNTLRKYKNENPGFSVLIDEINWWKSWQKATLLPQGISPAETAVYRQSLAILKMAQCRERIPARGQIVHSLAPGNMAIATIPGIGFSIDAFLKSGHFEEALEALQFIFNGRCGYMQHYTHTGEQRGIGQDYSVSSNYYYGNGIEAVETDDFGPILYLGNFGMILWNLREYIETTNDIRFLEYYWPKISSEIADVIVNNIDETGLVRMDNGFFNKGAPKHYFYSSVCAYQGIVDAVWLARMVSDETHAKEYESVAVALRQQIEISFHNPEQNAVKSFLEGDDTAVDAATAMGLLWVFTPQDYISKGTLASFEKHLASANGFRRYPESPTTTSDREWVVGNIFIATLNQNMTNFDKAQRIRNWVTGQALRNFGLIPEYYNQSAEYSGTVPLCGLGAGIYVSSLWGE
jgi:GH15 family glucan-1,4-alpha-glucosidase